MRSVEELWALNYNPSFNRWVVHLHDEYLAGSKGKDFDSIRFWIEEFKAGKNTQIYVSRKGYVCDGNHRLVAAKLAGLKEIGVADWKW